MIIFKIYLDDGDVFTYIYQVDDINGYGVKLFVKAMKEELKWGGGSHVSIMDDTGQYYGENLEPLEPFVDNQSYKIERRNLLSDEGV